MKKTICIISLVFASGACTGQIICKKTTPVDKVAVLISLPKNGTRPDYLNLLFKGDSIEDVKLDADKKCYFIHLDAKMMLTRTDLNPPVIKNYMSDPEQPVSFSVEKDNRKCQAEYFFRYLPQEIKKKYKLNIVHNSPTLLIDDTLKKEKPVNIIVEPGKKFVEVSIVYGSGWWYYHMYRINEDSVNIPLMHSADEIKKGIVDNPKNFISSPIARQYILDSRLKEHIKYTLFKL